MQLRSQRFDLRVAVCCGDAYLGEIRGRDSERSIEHVLGDSHQRQGIEVVLGEQVWLGRSMRVGVLQAHAVQRSGDRVLRHDLRHS